MTESLKTKSLPFSLKAMKKKQKIRLTLLLSNIVILIVILVFIVAAPTNDSIKSSTSLSLSSDGSSVVSDPLDQLASANIALTVAEVDNLPEETPISNQAESQQAELSQASTSDNVVSEPQVVQTALKSRADIFTYVTQPGDTVSSLADKFGITSDSILWSNNLSSSILSPGTTLVIPPITGIVYTVKSGDTLTSIAQKYNVNEAQLVDYNDAEINGITPGEQILIPGGTVATQATPTWSGPSYGYNGYDFGYCTWYVATQISVPSNWGNASSWAYYAALSGWNVSSNPSVGAIAQTADAAGGEGHVAIVEQISPDGSQVLIRDMNNYGDGGGWDKVGSGWVPTSSFQAYITQ